MKPETAERPEETTERLSPLKLLMGYGLLGALARLRRFERDIIDDAWPDEPDDEPVKPKNSLVPTYPFRTPMAEAFQPLLESVRNLEYRDGALFFEHNDERYTAPAPPDRKTMTLDEAVLYALACLSDKTATLAEEVVV